MHDTGPVDVPQRLRQPGAEPGQPHGAEGLFPYLLGERGGVDEQGGHPGPLGIGVRVHDGCGEGPAHPPGGCDLLPEPGPELRIRRVLGVYDLDREPQPGCGGGQMHHPHATGTQDGFQPVLPGVLRKTGPFRAQ